MCILNYLHRYALTLRGGIQPTNIIIIKQFGSKKLSLMTLIIATYRINSEKAQLNMRVLSAN